VTSLPDDLIGVCRAARLAFNAGSVSVAAVSGPTDEVAADHLHYIAADGRGADGIVGLRLPAGRGIAGFVAATGQALITDRVADDARFARDVAERVGYIPTTMLVVPVRADQGEVIGVLSVLDRTSVVAGSDALALGTALADVASQLLSHADDLDRDPRIGAVAANLHALEPSTRRHVLDVVEGVIGLAARRRPR
jgi:hypothetical protein